MGNFRGRPIALSVVGEESPRAWSPKSYFLARKIAVVGGKVDIFVAGVEGLDVILRNSLNLAFFPGGTVAGADARQAGCSSSWHRVGCRGPCILLQSLASLTAYPMLPWKLAGVGGLVLEVVAAPVRVCAPWDAVSQVGKPTGREPVVRWFRREAARVRPRLPRAKGAHNHGGCCGGGRVDESALSTIAAICSPRAGGRVGVESRGGLAAEDGCAGAVEGGRKAAQGLTNANAAGRSP